jgi:hypothetical protein
MNSKPLTGKPLTLQQPRRIQTANGEIVITKSGIWKGVGKAYLHDDPNSQPDTHLFSIPRAVKDGLGVTLSSDSTAFVVTHADESVSTFKLSDGLYRTTLGDMMKCCGNQDNELDEDPSASRIGIVTRSMSKSTPTTTSATNPISKMRPSPRQSSRSSTSSDDEMEPIPSIVSKSSNTLGNLTNRKTKIESTRAQEARDLHCAVGHPSDKVLKDMLSLGKFKDCSLSPRDVDAAKSLLGDCPACRSAKYA